MKKYDLSLSEQDIAIVMAALGELPVKVAIDTVNSILSQKNAADFAKHEIDASDNDISQAYKDNIDV